MSAVDPLPSSAFDLWADTYDQDVITQNVFPFAGYGRALETVVQLAAATRGMSVLDIGTGTGNQAARFAELGCKLWCTDFSQAMLDKARGKLPFATLVLHDLRMDWPPELNRRFDRIVSAYVFHHFGLEKKISLCQELVSQHLLPEGKLIIADLSFADSPAMAAFARTAGDLWEAEPYWLTDESLKALKRAGLKAQYVPVSSCAGVYWIESHELLRAQD